MLLCPPFLLFGGNCAEAMAFYPHCPGGELTLTKLGDTPMKEQFPPEKHHRIINAHLTSGALEFSATDWMASPAFEPILGNMSAIFVLGERYDELKAVFDKLADNSISVYPRMARILLDLLPKSTKLFRLTPQ